MPAFLNLHFLILSWLIHNMKPYLLYLFILSFLLLALPDEHSSESSSHSSIEGSAIQMETMYTGALLTAADHSGDLYTGTVHTEVSSGYRNKTNKAKKICTKRKCLKHHKEDSSPSGGVPAPVCSISLFAVLNQPEDFRFSAPATLASHRAFHSLILLSPDLEQDPHPPRYS